MLAFGNAPSTDIGIVGCDDQGGTFENWMLCEPHNAIMPLDNDQQDSWPVGMALDFCSQDSLAPHTPDDDPIPPCPVLWILNNVGWLMGYHVMNMDAISAKEPCSSMVKAVSAPGLSASIPSVKAVERPPPVKAIESQPLQVKPADASLPKPTFKAPELKVAPSPAKPLSAAPLVTKVPSTPASDPKLLSKFNEIYKGFEADLKMLQDLNKDLSKTIEKAQIPVDDNGSITSWTFANLSLIPSKVEEIATRLSQDQAAITEIKDGHGDIKLQVLSTFAKKEESQKRLEMLKNSTAADLELERERPLGPEAQNLKETIETKRKVFSHSTFVHLCRP